MKFREIELKYNAANIDFAEFEKFALNRKPLKKVIAAGFDHFYSNSKEKDSFCRHRVGPDGMNQLTFKRKDSGATNNVTRTEHNLDLAPNVTTDQVKALCLEFGYKYNTSIFKTCFVYQYDWYTFVFYIVQDLSMKEVGRFLEIEAKEDYHWGNEQEAMAAIVSIERFAKSLGITPQNRLKKSLWEMFKKE